MNKKIQKVYEVWMHKSLVQKIKLRLKKLWNKRGHDTLLDSIKVLNTGEVRAKSTIRGMWGIESVDQGQQYRYKQCYCVAGEFFYVLTDTGRWCAISTFVFNIDFEDISPQVSEPLKIHEQTMVA